MNVDDALLIEQGMSKELSIKECQDTLNKVVDWYKLRY